ncbi:MAG: transglutaminase family protein [Verrucomicrobiales bacterium]|nr:transglutaminase family protein [Verrucomicrobiales bacterium]
MSIHCALKHHTAYHYEKPVRLSPQVVRLRPAPHNRTPILSYSFKIGPQPHFLNWQQDPFGNFQARLVFPEPVRSFEVEVDLVADLSSINPFDFFMDEDVEYMPVTYDPALESELSPFRRKKRAGTELRKLIEIFREPEGKERTIDYLVRINQGILERVKYLIRMEPGVQTPEETLLKGSGSCRDSSWLLVNLLRHLGFASRFTSGYLIQLKPDQKPLEGPAGTEEDFTDLHAWVDVYLPGAGWVGFDPTSGLCTGEGHIPLAATPEPRSASPVTGYLMDECESTFDFEMKVTRIHEIARVTKPYSRAQWKEIDALGKLVDQRLAEQNLNLTMGGEPTFVSIDDMDGDEWNTAAMGPMKRHLADDLLKRLHKRFGEGGFLHHGQGKWYPGEQLPRWNFSCHWRRDGMPAWEDPSLIAEEEVDYGHTNKESAEFIKLLAKNLGVTTKHIMPAHEDVWYYLWRERRLPANVDPFDSKLEDEIERARLSKVFEQGLDRVVGHVLPLWRGLNPVEWITGPWFLRPERLYLMPGDSSIGYRLPLESLPWTNDEWGELLEPLDPSLPRDPFPPGKFRPFSGQPEDDRIAEEKLQFPHRKGKEDSGEGPIPISEYDAGRPEAFFRGESISGIVRTALCVEPRNGNLNVFMPPVKRAEDYLELVTALEQTAAELGTPIMLEGYLPPRDSRLNHFSVTPDPGVIEVNIHPSHSWEELREITRGIYADARESRLGTEKFMLDGRHSGTGGGNHIVVGGPTTMESPFLKNPSLLRSFVSYWHNHPSLSYLFSGLFIGPTSQAPRIDEARDDSLHELEIAFKQLPDYDPTLKDSPAVVDRVLRNMLVDITGNTHRAEFCIDKLYSPDSSSGRLGLVEMRGFEMPPHPEMSLAQLLLVRAGVSRFQADPYRESLVRWGTGLHDRFLLPHFIRQDFEDVLDDFTRHGFPFDPAWFDPHYEFRFPLIGSIAHRGVKVELREAIEPWHVLGEEQSSGGTSRYVDSSVERIEVKVSGMTDPRHILTCQQRKVPLSPTGRPGEFVAGVRFRAWAPTSARHPTMDIHSPLTFDLVDLWNERSVGGCEYHVTHPGGRSYEDFPINAYTAQSRRSERFVPFGHTPGTIRPKEEPISKEFPFTLDLQT